MGTQSIITCSALPYYFVTWHRVPTFSVKSLPGIQGLMVYVLFSSKKERLTRHHKYHHRIIGMGCFQRQHEETLSLSIRMSPRGAHGDDGCLKHLKPVWDSADYKSNMDVARPRTGSSYQMQRSICLQSRAASSVQRVQKRRQPCGVR